MYKKLIITIAFLMTLFNTQANADVAYNDDMIAQGSLCSGMDCIDGELFGSSTLVLKENNTRIRFLDNSAANALGQSWIAIANNNSNGGMDYFQFQVRSLEMDAVKISNGNAPLLDCSTATYPYPTSPTYIVYTCTPVGQIPAGDPVLVQGDTSIPNDFVTVPWYTERPVLYFGKAADGGIALGANSEVVNSAVSVGKAGLERKIVHVAQALAATDLATVADIIALNKLLDAIDVQLDDIEQTVIIIGAPVNTIAPEISGTVTVGNVLTASTGTWTDRDGDTPTYSYQWAANGTNIVGATSNSYMLSANETGKAIAVIVTAVDGNGGNINASSNVTAAVDSDFDLDSTGDSVDTDDDNDGVLDTDDVFPLDASESVDTDSDGVGDNADVDDDNDGLPDMFEIILGLDPLNANDTNYDLDADMYSNLVEYSFGSRLDDITSVPAIALLGADTDGDGVPDFDDAFPADPTEFIDTDGDGIGNRADSDDDDDGVSDNFDEMPLDDSEVDDSDGDNVGDNTDAFPNDATESDDTDLDGVGDNGDTDADGDGVDNSLDAFPLNATETVDTDADGVGDNTDAFPNDPSESLDTDLDGNGNNADTDDDNDGVADISDNCPLVPNAAQADTDNNGLGDLCDGADNSVVVTSPGGGGSFNPGLLLLLGAPLAYFRYRQQRVKQSV